MCNEAPWDYSHTEEWLEEAEASSEAAGCAQKSAKCHECGRFVSQKELDKVPSNGVPMCDDCVSGIDEVW
jgi:NAD-dependent SIR2 family protein deacetylase